VSLALLLAKSDAGNQLTSPAKGLYDTPASIAPARNLFAFSIGYLFSLFAALLGEHLGGIAPLTALTTGSWS